MGGDLVFPSLVIFDRVAAVLRTAYQNKYCSPGLGAGASTSTKNHPLSGKENRWFCKSGYQLALLARLLSIQSYLKTDELIQHDKDTEAAKRQRRIYDTGQSCNKALPT